MFGITNLSHAQLNYSTYASAGGSPEFPNPLTATPLSTGTVSSVNFNWGGGQVLDSGRADGVIARFTGYYKVPGVDTQTYQFGVTADDGLKLSLNNTAVVDFWADQGPTFRSGSITLTGGTVVPVELWFYENGGGATLIWYWWDGSSWQVVDAANLSTESTFGGTVNNLCCGASSAAFSANQNFANRVSNFTNNSSQNGDNRVVIQQVGNSSTLSVTQQGKRNYAEVNSNGSNNTVTVNQTVSTASSLNYAEVNLTGSSNSVTVIQNSSGGTKSVLVGIADTANTVSVQQTDSSSHYAEISLSGSNKTIDLKQSGSAAHMARIELGGGATGITTVQRGNIQQFYSINHSCAQTSCAAISVTQGQ